MTTLMRGACIAACLLAAGCSLPEGSRGATCARSAQCGAGLVCVQHKCGANLASIAEGSVVPNLGGAAPGDAAIDGSADAASVADGAAADDDGGG